MKAALFALGLLLSFGFTSVAFAAADVQGRFFIGASDVKPKEVNDETQTAGLKKISATLLLGAEVTYPVFSKLDLGLRYIKSQVGRDEEPANALSEYEVAIEQNMLMLIARHPFLKNNFVRADIFAGFGGAATRLKLTTTSQDGEMKSNTFSRAVSAAGASVALGYKSFFLFVEGGYMQNQAGNFVRTGTINENIKYVDMSGSYFLVGFQLNNPQGLMK